MEGNVSVPKEIMSHMSSGSQQVDLKPEAKPWSLPWAQTRPGWHNTRGDVELLLLSVLSYYCVRYSFIIFGVGAEYDAGAHRQSTEICTTAQLHN